MTNLSKESMEELQPINVTGELRFHERIISGIVNILTSGIIYIPLLPRLLKNGFKADPGLSVKQSITYEENDGVVLCEKSGNFVLTKPFGCFNCLTELLFSAANKHPDRKCLGRRSLLKKYEEKDKLSDRSLVKYEFSDYTWKTFKEVVGYVENISKNMLDLGFNENQRLALFSNTSAEWIMTAFGAMNIASPFITVYSTLSNDSISYALKLTEVIGVLVDEKTLPRLKAMIKELPHIRYVFVSKYIETPDVTNKGFPEHVKVIDFNDIISYNGQTDCQGHQPKENTQLAMIMFTSGSSGIPKGVMITHKNMLSVVGSVSKIDVVIKYNIYAAFLPSSHIFEFLLEIALIGFGSSVGFCTPLTLFETSPMIKEGSLGDLTVLKPTIIITVPLLLERVKKKVLDTIKSGGRFKQILFQVAYNNKMSVRKKGYKTPLLDAIVFKRLKSIFGGNIDAAFIGGAYVSRDTEEFANICFGNFRQGYGLTETCAAVLFTDIGYGVTGSAGSPMSHVEIKLIPWEEGGCDPKDPKHPAGEIVIHGDAVSLGYYKNEELTSTSYITDPVTKKLWFHTGDIGLVLPDRTLKIIDRKKDIIKLQHGEYVSLVKVEAIISKSPLVDIACVLPSKEMSHLVAIIVPNREKAHSMLVKENIISANDSIDTKLEDASIRERIAEMIRDFALPELGRNEVPSTFNVLSEIWTPESNLITPTIKLKRTEIAKQYHHLLL